MRAPAPRLFPTVGTLLLLVLQSPALAAQASDATIPVAGAEAFLGNWTVNVTGDTGPVTLQVAFTNNDGRLAVRISGGVEGTEGRTIQRISRGSDGALQVAYSLTVQGQAVPSVLTLTSQGATTAATISLAGGQLVLRGDAKKAP
jgi:hypothetical protein